MPRDYICALCSTRYEYIPPDGCYCSDSATTIFHDGKESERIREEQQRRDQIHQEELKTKEAQKKKAKPKPSKSNSSSEIGAFIGLVAFLGSGYLLRFKFEFEWIPTIIAAVVIGVIIRYTYKLIVLLILLLVGYYIYDQYIKEDKTSYNQSNIEMTITSSLDCNPQEVLYPFQGIT